MDIADMILARAKEIEKEDERDKSLEFKLRFHVHARNEDEECVNEEMRFCIIPLKDDSNKLMLTYKNTKWIQCKNSKYIYKLVKIVFRQILRDIIEIVDHSLYETDVLLEVLYRKEQLFTDEYFIDDPITIADLSMYNINDCNENDELKDVQDMLIGHVETCLHMEF